MDLKIGFWNYAAAHPCRQGDVRRTSHALRIAGIDTMEQLREQYQLSPGELLRVRDIGPARLEQIGAVLRFYEAMAPPDVPPNDKVD